MNMEEVFGKARKEIVSFVVHVERDTPGLEYGLPGAQEWFDIEDVRANDDGSYDVRVCYTRLQCKDCRQWFDWLAFDAPDEDLCEACFAAEAGRHECETGDEWHAESRKATTVRQDLWLCDECADRWDNAWGRN